MRAQGLPVNMIVLTALALLVLIVVAVFFISGFSQASSSIQVTDATQAQCQGKCQNIVIGAFNYNSCTELYGYTSSCTGTGCGSCSCTCPSTGGTASCTGTGCTAEPVTCTCGNCVFGGNPQANDYVTNCASLFGACRVTIRNGQSCTCDNTGCHS